MLTPRENFFLMMQQGRPHTLPLDLTVTPPVADKIEENTGTRDLAAAFGIDFKTFGVDFPGDEKKWRAAFDDLGFPVPANAEIWSSGVTHVPPPAESAGEAYHFREMLHPLSGITEISQLEALPWPDLENPAAGAGLAERIAAIRNAGRVAVAAMECTVFECAWYLRGMDNLFGDLMDENGISDWLLDWFTEQSIRKARLAVAAGVDVIGLGDDVGTQRGMMMSVPFWRQHLKPRLKRVIDAIRETQKEHVYIRYHSDGDIRPIIDDLVEIGVDLLNPVQPECMPLAEVIPQHQHHLAFWGMIGTQTTMPFGTPADVQAIVDECAGYARAGARLVIAPTHVLEPDVPWANIQALVKAVRGVKL
jgi:uroporphyrinogen decarboxylase